MPLDPRLSLLINPPQVQPLDYGGTLLQGAQLARLQQQQQAQALALQDALLQRQRGEALQAYIREQMGPGQGTPTPAAPRITPPPGEPPFIRGPQQAPWQGGEMMSPAAIQRTLGTLPGTTYRRMEEVEAPTGTRQQAQTTTVETPHGPMRISDRLDWRKMYALDPKNGLEMFDTLRKMEQGDAATQMTMLSKGIDFLDNVLSVVTDQATLDKAHAAVGRTPLVGAELEGMLPRVYDEATIERTRQRLVPIKQRMQLNQRSLNITYGRDAQGNIVPLQATQAGGLEQAAVPPGVQVLPPTRPLDVGTGYTFAGPGGTVLGGTVTKDVRGEAEQKAAGGVTGKVAGELPQKAREAQATLATIDQKHQLVGQEIDRALQIVSTSTLPTTGVVGNVLKTVYQPGRDLESLLETISANIGLDELQSLKGSGSTLGQVTEAEHRLLQAVMGNLKQSQSQAQFTQNLRRLKTTLAEVKQRRQHAAAQQFGRGVVPVPPSPHGTVPVDQLSPQQLDEEERWIEDQLRQQQGR